MIGIDIGGTFTDVVLLHDKRLARTKVLSSPGNYSDAVQTAVESLCEEIELAPSAAIGRLVHATTVVTNTLLEGSGARTAFVTTRGFRDILALARNRRPSLYDLGWRKPRPIVPRALCYEVDERVGPAGEVITPLDIPTAREVIRRVIDKNGVEAVAVCLLNSFANPVHEQLLGEIVLELAPELHVSLSSSVMPKVREYERASTTAVNAYVAPRFQRYVSEMQQAFTAKDVSTPLLLMQSNGGVVPASAAVRRPVTMIESGPAAGALAVARLASELQRDQVIALDVGGTTAKACLVERGRALETSEFVVGGAINSESRLLQGGGYVVAVPSIDIAEVGAGGGSIARIDSGGYLKVGPDSAGSLPGPACYGRGGLLPTITDAFAVLGLLDPAGIAGGEQKVDVDAADRALRQLAQPLGVTTADVAWGVYRVGTATMMRAVRAVTTERGRDTRRMEVVAFGGAGPLHAAELALQLQIPRVLVPPLPGLFSALGLLLAQLRFDFVSGLPASTILTASALESGFMALEQEATTAIRSLDLDASQAVLTRVVEARYEGQMDQILLETQRGASEEAVRKDFATQHKVLYGHPPQMSNLYLTSLRVVASLPGAHADYRSILNRVENVPQKGISADRPVFFGKEYGWITTPIVSREDLSGSPEAGPVIVQEYDTTIVVPPRMSVCLDSARNVAIETEKS